MQFYVVTKTHPVLFLILLNYGDTENVLINHLFLVIPMSYPCHYTNLCPHKPHKHAHMFVGNQMIWVPIDFHCMEKYIIVSKCK